MNTLLLAAVMLFVTTPAFACKVQFGIGSNNKRIQNIQQRLAAHKKINAKQRVLLADYTKDSAAYKAAMDKGWPVCSEQGGTDCFANCSALSARELAAAPYVTDGLHYRVSPEQQDELQNKKKFLTEKWKH